MKKCQSSFIFGLFLLFTANFAVAAPASTLLDATMVVPEAVALGISPTVMKISPQRMQKLREKEDQYYLQITIGQVTAEQFQKLKNLYGGFSQVRYEAAKSYDLVDFLPPVIQATVNKTFTYRTYNTQKLADMELEGPDFDGLWPIRKNGLSFYTNCWSTTLESLKFMNSAHPPKDSTYTIMWSGRWETDEIIKDNQYSALVKEKDLRIGDALIASVLIPAAPDMSMLQHTALLLGQNLVFEKTDTSENDAYRLALRTDVDAKLKHIFENDLQVEYRRFGGNKKPLPSRINPTEYNENQKKILLAADPAIPVDRLSVGCETGNGGGCDPVVSEYQFVQLKIDPQTGRGVLVGPASAMSLFRDLSKEP